MENFFDVIIIGAGPIGLSCGIEAKKNNLSHLIIDKGCIVNSIYNYPTNMTFFSTSERLEIGEVPFVSHGDKPTRREALEYYRRIVDSWQLNVITYEEVKNITNEKSLFTVLTDKDEYFCKSLIIATGFYDNPNYMNIKGEELPKVKHYFDEAHPYAYRNIAVVGAGNSAVDVALETYRKNANVTMIVKEANLKEGIKYWVRPDIENRIKEKSITAYFNSEIFEIREKEIIVKTPDDIIVIPNDFVFAMTGYHSNFDLLKKVGVEISPAPQRTPCFNPNTFETNVKGVYLGGVVLSGMDTSKWVIENTRFHCKNIFENIGKENKL
ncbi:MAG TPA: YpdA family putative bacillithiol disulfide reductase [Ignavibacteriaceae bacterium]|nr:YpdA family putative bacillithiol disulfide reductase [Ignavibacteriaceae bacterium]